jgi:hypothetical protein
MLCFTQDAVNERPAAAAVLVHSVWCYSGQTFSISGAAARGWLLLDCAAVSSCSSRVVCVQQLINSHACFRWCSAHSVSSSSTCRLQSATLQQQYTLVFARRFVADMTMRTELVQSSSIALKLVSSSYTIETGQHLPTKKADSSTLMPRQPDVSRGVCVRMCGNTDREDKTKRSSHSQCASVIYYTALHRDSTQRASLIQDSALLTQRASVIYYTTLHRDSTQRASVTQDSVLYIHILNALALYTTLHCIETALNALALHKTVHYRLNALALYKTVAF